MILNYLKLVVASDELLLSEKSRYIIWKGYEQKDAIYIRIVPYRTMNYVLFFVYYYLAVSTARNVCSRKLETSTVTITLHLCVGLLIHQ